MRSSPVALDWPDVLAPAHQSIECPAMPPCVSLHRDRGDWRAVAPIATVRSGREPRRRSDPHGTAAVQRACRSRGSHRVHSRVALATRSRASLSPRAGLEGPSDRPVGALTAPPSDPAVALTPPRWFLRISLAIPPSQPDARLMPPSGLRQVCLISAAFACLVWALRRRSRARHVALGCVASASLSGPSGCGHALERWYAPSRRRARRSGAVQTTEDRCRG